MAFNDLALQVVRSFCFPLPYCREPKFSPDLKLGRVVDPPSAGAEGFWLGLECMWRRDGLSLGRVMGHVLVWSEGGTARPSGKGTTLAWHSLGVFSVAYGCVACRVGYGTVWGEMGNNVFCCTFLFLACWTQKATQRMWELQASAAFGAAMNLAPTTQRKYEDRWLMLWETSEISATSLYSASLARWLPLKTTDIIWTQMT